MPLERPRIGDWNEEESFAAFQGHVNNNDISKDDLMRLRPWHNLPWRHHDCKLKLGDIAPDSKVFHLDGTETSIHQILEASNRPVVLVFGSITCPPFRNMFLQEICDIVG